MFDWTLLDCQNNHQLIQQSNPFTGGRTKQRVRSSWPSAVFFWPTLFLSVVKFEALSSDWSRSSTVRPECRCHTSRLWRSPPPSWQYLSGTKCLWNWWHVAPRCRRGTSPSVHSQSQHRTWSAWFGSGCSVYTLCVPHRALPASGAWWQTDPETPVAPTHSPGSCWSLAGCFL